MAAIILAMSYMAFIDGDEPSIADVKSSLYSSIAIGTTSSDIEQFFVQNHVNYSFDPYQRKFHGIIRNVSHKPFVDKAIEIDVKVDDNGKCADISVYATYTFL